MSEQPSLHEMLTETINAYLQQTGGGIPNGFIYAVNYIDSDGLSNNDIGCMEEQSPVLSSGLLSYLSKVCDVWVEDALHVNGCACGSEGEE